MTKSKSSGVDKKTSKDNDYLSGTVNSFRYCSSDKSSAYVLGFIVVTALAFGTRFYKVTEPDHVVWDETHFGKFGSWYINRTFFFDVHPPLGKMLIGGFGYITGYDGAFPFVKPGDKYENVSYIGMRVACTTMGAALIPFSYVTVWEMTHSLPASFFAAALILADNGFLTLSQYILLDPILLFFIMGSVMGAAKFNSQRDRPFTFWWWYWMFYTGTMLSGSISVKFVGLFVVVYVGLQTIAQLWDLLGNLKNSLFYVAKHFIARAVGLIALPIFLYLFYFYIHLTVLSKTGNGDGFYSSAFQSQLEGNSLYNASMPLELSYGAEITLKSARTGGGYLHSHVHLYPEGMVRQQQITTYSHKDYNNKWVLKKQDTEPLDWDDEDEKPEIIKHGDLVRLEHLPTGRNLHSHREPAPETTRHFQVSGYGENGVGDVNDVWRVEIDGGYEGESVKAVLSKVRLIHVNVQCALMSSTKQLPKWGFEQHEVTCNPHVGDADNLWNFEENVYPKLPNTSFQIYAPSFFSKFVEAHIVMFQGNAGLKPKEGEITSQPWQWPINYRGQWFSAIDGYKVYLLGNPLIWWGNLVVMGLFVVAYVINSAAEKRGLVSPHTQSRRNIAIRSSCWLLLAWGLHYVPFYFMGRVLYFHHYFPALLFSSMMSGILIDYVLESISLSLPSSINTTSYIVMTSAVLALLSYSFYLFTPLCYGMHEVNEDPNNSTLKHLKWLSTWEF